MSLPKQEELTLRLLIEAGPNGLKDRILFNRIRRGKAGGAELTHILYSLKKNLRKIFNNVNIYEWLPKKDNKDTYKFMISGSLWCNAIEARKLVKKALTADEIKVRIDIFRKAYELDPDSFEAVAGLSTSYLDAGEKSEAAVWNNAALEMMPNDKTMQELKKRLQED